MEKENQWLLYMPRLKVDSAGVEIWNLRHPDVEITYGCYVQGSPPLSEQLLDSYY